MIVNIKRLHKDAVIPSYSKAGDAGMDLTAISKDYDSNRNVVYGTGLSFEIPEGYVGLLFPRSSVSKSDLRLTNSVGVVDSGYRGEVSFKFRNDNFNVYKINDNDSFTNLSFVAYNEYDIGDRIGQLLIIPYPQIEFNEKDDLSETERGEGGYGSTGK